MKTKKIYKMSNSLNKEDYLGWEDQELYNRLWNESKEMRLKLATQNTSLPQPAQKVPYTPNKNGEVIVKIIKSHFEDS